MSEFESLRIRVPGINKPGPFGFVKDAIQEYIFTATSSGRSIITPVIPARLIMSEEERHTDVYGSKKFVRSGPDLTLDLETKNNAANVTTLLDLMEHNAIYIYKGKMADYNIKDRDTYETEGLPIVTIEHETRRYIISKDGRPYRSVDKLTSEDPTPKNLQFEPIGKKAYIEGLGNEWTDIDNQLATNYRPKGNGDKPIYYKVPKISSDIREDAVRTFISTYPERMLSGRDVLLDQFPEWDTLTDEQKARDPFDELVRLMRPVNVYDGVTDEEYYNAIKMCVQGVLVGSAIRQFRPARVDMFPVLIGNQGAGKTTYCNFLGADISTLDTFIRSLDERSPFKGEVERSASDESGNRHADNKIWERSNTKIVTEFLEGNALRKSTINTFKMLADKTTVSYARLYEDEHEEALTTTFWTTVNEPKPLYDTENRRFFPIWFGGDLANPSPIVDAIKTNRNSEEYRQRMAVLWDILLVSRAHARHLAETGHNPQEYFGPEFVRVQQTINSQSVTSDPIEEKIGSIIRKEAPEIIHELAVKNKDGIDYAPMTRVESELKVKLSEYIPSFHRPDVARAFKNAWNNRAKYGVFKDPDGNGGIKIRVGDNTIRAVYLIRSDGTPRPWYEV